MEDVMKQMAASAKSAIAKRGEQIKAQQELLESMGETNRVMGERLVKLEADDKSEWNRIYDAVNEIHQDIAASNLPSNQYKPIALKLIDLKLSLKLPS